MNDRAIQITILKALNVLMDTTRHGYHVSGDHMDKIEQEIKGHLKSHDELQKAITEAKIELERASKELRDFDNEHIIPTTANNGNDADGKMMIHFKTKDEYLKHRVLSDMVKHRRDALNGLLSL